MIWIEFSILLWHVGVINLILILSCPFSIQWREPYKISFFKKSKVGLYSDTYRPNSFKLDLIIEITILYILIQFRWPWLSFKVAGVWEFKTVGVSYSQKFPSWCGWNSVCCHTCWFVEAHVKFICTSNLKGDTYWPDFIEHTFSIWILVNRFVSNLTWC